MNRIELEAHVNQIAEAEVARLVAEADAARTREREQREAQEGEWRAALRPTVVACGVRPFFVDGIVEDARGVFELRDGKLRPKPGVLHPTDPVADLDPVRWLADLREGPEGALLFGK